MRVGELAGLNIGDVHVLGSRGTISVHCTFDKRYSLSSSPKTSRSNRTVTLVPAVVPLFAAYLASRRADGAGDGDPLFNARKSGGHYMDDWNGTIIGAEREKHASTPKTSRARSTRPSGLTRWRSTSASGFGRWLWPVSPHYGSATYATRRRRSC
jgi:integrase